jgi:serine/threonine protein kinase
VTPEKGDIPGISETKTSWTTMQKEIKTKNDSFAVTRVAEEPANAVIDSGEKRFIGFSHSLHAKGGRPFVNRGFQLYLRVYRKLRSIYQERNAEREIRRLESRKQEILSLGQKGYRLRIEKLGLDEEKVKEIRELQKKSREVEIAEIDQDGFLLSQVGPIKTAPTVSTRQFHKRWRYKLKVVTIDGYVGVKKHYGSNKVAFLNEITALHQLGLAGCNVPAILDVDFDNYSLASSYILGNVLRERLAEEGAVVRDRDVIVNTDFMLLNPEERYFRRIREGRCVLYKVIDPSFAEDLFAELARIHGARFVLNEIKYGNILIEKMSGKPYLIDFEKAEHYPRMWYIPFKFLCSGDIESYHLHFNPEYVIEKR